MNYIKRGLQGLLLSASMLGLTGCGEVSGEKYISKDHIYSLGISVGTRYRELREHHATIIYDPGSDATSDDDAIYVLPFDAFDDATARDAFIHDGVGRFPLHKGKTIETTVGQLKLSITLESVLNENDDDPGNNVAKIKYTLDEL